MYLEKVVNSILMFDSNEMRHCYLYCDAIFTKFDLFLKTNILYTLANALGIIKIVCILKNDVFIIHKREN